MPKIKVLPHAQLCPEGADIEGAAGEPILQVLLDHGIAVEHACDMQCACTTCHVYVRKGLSSLIPATEKEEDMLDKAWGLDMDSRLSCQAKLDSIDIVVEIPKYTINLAAEEKK